MESVYDTIFRFACSWGEDKEQAEDITQNACLKLAKNINSFRFESSFASWLFILVKRCALDCIKNEQRSSVLSKDLQPLTAVGDKSENYIYIRQVIELIDTLPRDLRETMVLVHGFGLSQQQTAERLSLSVGTVGWRISEARKYLLTSLNKV